MKVVVISFLIIFLSYSSGNKHYCGRILSNTLAYMCEQENLVKRALPNYGFQGYRDGESTGSVLRQGTEQKPMKRGGSVSQDFIWPLFGQKQALALSGIRGKRQGVADECCLKKCSLDELLSYC